jgi:hypothetical protein
MRRPPRALTALLTAPFLAGCFATLPTPLPEPGARAGVQVRGVVLRAADGTEGERVEFDEVLDVQWREDALSVFGMRRGGARAQPASHDFAYDDLSAVLTRQVDVNKTSGLVAGGMIALLATVTFLVTGKTREGGPIGGIGGR